MFHSLLAPLNRALAWIGRYGTQGFALSIFLGLALPQLAEAARPLLPVTIFFFLVITFARADVTAVKALLRRPALLIGACTWLVVAPVVIILAVIAMIGREAIDPGLLLGLAVMGAAPPIMSSPAVAILYGFEPTLIIAAVVIVTLLSPIISPPVANLIAGAAVPLDPLALSLRLLFFVGGGLLVGLLLRFAAGPARIARSRSTLDGAGVVFYFLFAIAAMDGVTNTALTRPTTVALFLAIAFGISLFGLAASLVVLRPFRPSDRFMLGYGSGQRNMGMLIAALGAGVPGDTFLFFALAQFPIYLMPQLLKGWAGRIRVRSEQPGG